MSTRSTRSKGSAPLRGLEELTSPKSRGRSVTNTPASKTAAAKKGSSRSPSKSRSVSRGRRADEAAPVVLEAAEPVLDATPRRSRGQSVKGRGKTPGTTGTRKSKAASRTKASARNEAGEEEATKSEGEVEEEQTPVRKGRRPVSRALDSVIVHRKRVGSPKEGKKSSPSPRNSGRNFQSQLIYSNDGEEEYSSDKILKRPSVSSSSSSNAAAAKSSRRSSGVKVGEPGLTTDNGTAAKVWILLVLFLSALGLQYWIYTSLPQAQKPYPLCDNGSNSSWYSCMFKFIPRNLEDTRKVALYLQAYKEEQYWSFLGLYFSIFIFVQTFIIPGGFFLNVLASMLFGPYVSICLICLGCAIGSTLCFTISQTLGARLIFTLFPSIKAQEKQLSLPFLPKSTRSSSTNPISHQLDLLSYILLARIAPMIPNWFVNLSFPHLFASTWYATFFIGTLVGSAALCLIHVQIGQALLKTMSAFYNEATATIDHNEILWSVIFDPMNVGLLVVTSLMAALPLILRRRQE